MGKFVHGEINAAPRMASVLSAGPPLMDNELQRSLVLDALAGVEEAERQEAEYEWFRYSKAAFPFLIFLLLVAAALFCLTIWQGGFTLKHFRPGVPRQFELERDDGNDTEAGINEENRDMRIAAFVITIVGILVVLIFMYLKPKMGLRKAAYFGGAVLMIIGGILAIIAFAMDVGEVNNATRCRGRDEGNVIVFDARVRCEEYDDIALTTTILVGVMGFLAIFTGIIVIVAAIKLPKDIANTDFDNGYIRPPVRTSRTAKLVVLGFLFLTLIVAIMSIVFTVLLHEARETLYLDEVEGTRYGTNDLDGWPVKNTRLRFALTCIVLLLLVLSLVPFRSRVIAYVLAFCLLVCSALAVFVFALDVKDVDTARDFPCPQNYDCKFHRFIATCVLDLILALGLLAYVLLEFILRVAGDTTHAALY